MQWIGKIPKHWTVDNPKWHFVQRKDRATKGLTQLTASQKYGVVTQEEYMEITGAKVVTVEKDFDILKLVCPGDFIIHMRSFQGGLEYSEKYGSISSAYVMLIPQKTIVGAFAPYYTTTLLSNSVTPTAIYDLEAQIDAYAIIDPDDVDKVNEILYKEKVQSADKKKINFCLDKSQKLIEHYSIEKQREIVVDLRHFVRFYEFMIQVSSFEDTELHKKYNYIILLLSHINIKHPGPGFNLDGKIRATQFVQKKQGEHTESDIVAKPVVKLPSAETFGLTPAKEERLSEIIAAINARTGKSYDSDVAVKAMLQIRDILMKSDKLKASAKNNTVKDFEFSYFDDIDDALIEGLEQNQDFFSLLLNDEEIKREVLGIFTEEIYNSLKKAAEE